jgi:hypothetical protein
MYVAEKLFDMPSESCLQLLEIGHADIQCTLCKVAV